MGGSQPGLARPTRIGEQACSVDPSRRIRPPYVGLSDEPSSTSVNGPSFNSSTSIIAPNTPRADLHPAGFERGRERLHAFGGDPGILRLDPMTGAVPSAGPHRA